jgi:lycopene beta-cyclase
VLFKANYLGKTIFSNLFTKKNPTDILSFLDEETSLTTELKVMWACPKIPFIKALIKRLL